MIPVSNLLNRPPGDGGSSHAAPAPEVTVLEGPGALCERKLVLAGSFLMRFQRSFRVLFATVQLLP